jgi:hypothetical protein
MKTLNAAKERIVEWKSFLFWRLLLRQINGVIQCKSSGIKFNLRLVVSYISLNCLNCSLKRDERKMEFIDIQILFSKKRAITI